MNSLKPSLSSSTVRMPSLFLSNYLKVDKRRCSVYLDIILLVIYAITACSSFLSHVKFFNYWRALTQIGFCILDFSVYYLIHGSFKASAADILLDACFCKSFLMKSLANLLTEVHSYAMVKDK